MLSRQHTAPAFCIATSSRRTSSMSQYGEPGLTDFGIAGRTADVDDDEDSVSRCRGRRPRCCSERVRTAPRCRTSTRSAATVWHLLAGRSPFEIVGGDNSSLAIMAACCAARHRPRVEPMHRPHSTGCCSRRWPRNRTTGPSRRLEFARGLQAVEQELRFARTETSWSARMGRLQPLHSMAQLRTRHGSASRPQPVDPSGLARVWAPRNGPDTVARGGPRHRRPTPVHRLRMRPHPRPPSSPSQFRSQPHRPMPQ